MSGSEPLIRPEKLRRLRKRLDARIERRERMRKLLVGSGKKRWWKRLLP